MSKLGKNNIKNLIENQQWNNLAKTIRGRADECIDIVRECGCLKTSNKEFEISHVLTILSCIIGLPQKNISIDRIKRNLKKGISKKNKAYIHSVLILLDLNRFVKQSYNNLSTQSLGNKYEKLLYINKLFYNEQHAEKEAEFFSYALNNAPNTPFNLNVNKVDRPSEFNDIEKILFYKDLEELVNNFFVTLSKDNNLILINDEEKWFNSLSYGFLRLHLQRQSLMMNFYDKSKMASDQKANEIIKLHNLSQFISINSNCYEINHSQLFQSKHAIQDIKRFVKAELWYGDEKPIVAEIYKDLQIPLNELNNNFIKKQLSIKTLLKFRRLSCLLDCLVKAKGTTPYCIRIEKKLLRFFLSKEFGQPYVEAMRLLTQVHTSNTYVDIQYTPILSYKNYFLIPTSVLFRSNIIQNTMRFLKNDARLDDKGQRDLIAEKYEFFFKEKKIPYVVNFSYSTLDNHHGEIDLIYQLDDEIFISENKNMLPPTCYHDAINALKDYEKAKKQKRLFEHYFSKNDPILMNGLHSLLNNQIDFANAKKIHFYLTFGNRFALCKNTKDFPVVYIGEIISMMKNAPLKIYKGSLVTERKWRNSDELHANDVKEYLEKERILDDAKICKTTKIFYTDKIEFTEYKGTQIRIGDTQNLFGI